MKSEEMKLLILYSIYLISLPKMEAHSGISGVSKVCIGGKLVLTCTTSESALVWKVRLINNQGILDMEEWFFSSMDISNQTQRLVINQTTFTSTRTSARYSSPLVSTLTITNVSNALNMTQINCTEVIDGMLATAPSSTTITTTINITSLMRVTIKQLSQQFESSAVRVILDWTNEDGFLYSYYFSTDPLLEHSFDGNTTVELTVLYNTLYNVSVVATHPCSLNNATSFIELYYTKCGNPASLIDPSVTIINYSDPALAGSNVSFSCDPGYELNGPSTLTCTDDGKWIPSPRNSTCKMTIRCAPPFPPVNGYIIPYTSTAKGAVVTYVFQSLNIIDSRSVCTEVNVTAVCSHEGQWESSSTGEFCEETTGSTPNNNENIIVVSSSVAVTMFAVGAVVFFLFGFLCGCLYQRQKHLPISSSPSASYMAPVYDDVHLPQYNQELKLSKNVAYGPPNIPD